MLKFAANLTTLFNEYTFEDRFEQAAIAGFSAVEYLFPYEYDADLLAQKLEQYNLKQVLFNMYPGDWNAGERGCAAIPGKEDEFKRTVELALLYARKLDCKCIHAMSGVVDDEFTYDEHVQTFVKNIRYAADKFSELGITLVIEPLNPNDMPGYFVSSQREAAELIKLVERDNVKIQFDFYHAQIVDGDICNLIKDLFDHIGHIQIASNPDRHEPDSGELNYPFIFAKLNQLGYQGWIGCEYVPQHDTHSGLTWVRPYL